MSRVRKKVFRAYSSGSYDFDYVYNRGNRGSYQRRPSLTSEIFKWHAYTDPTVNGTNVSFTIGMEW